MGWEIVGVPGNPPCNPSIRKSTVDVIASVVEPKLANTLVRKLGQVAPLENLRHVKRVQRRNAEEQNVLFVILCPAVDDENQLESISCDVLKLINIHQLHPFVTKVAKYAASSKEEWEEQCKLWPTSYHPSTSGVGISDFTEEESLMICNFMKGAIEMAMCNQCGYQGKNAVVIVDPSRKQIIANAVDQTFSRPAIKNSSRNVGITSLPDSNGGDFHPICASGACIQSNTTSSCLYPWKWKEHNPHPERTLVKCGSDGSWHPLKHAVMIAIDKAAAIDKKLFPDSSSPKDLYALKDEWDSKSSPLKKQKTQNMENGKELIQNEAIDGLHSEVTRPYLCTGYDIYLVYEPCAMCAMALVHQRIRRIFYAFPNPNAGALGSVYRLQGEKSLNHHYSVFEVSLTEDVCDN